MIRAVSRRPRRRGRAAATTAALALAAIAALLPPARLASAARAAAATVAAAGKREDPREVEARALFARGEYRPALELFSRLFAENPDPVYYRNIGRCHQKLGDPDRAIAAFQEYLQRAGRLRPSERKEIDGYIREMQALQALRAERPPAGEPPTAPPPQPPPVAVATVAPEPVAPAAVVPAIGAAPEADRARTDDARPVTRRWWFWALIGGAVAAGAATAIVLSRGGGAPDRLSCPGMFTCPP